jgi:hypothetical protein
LGVFVGRGFGVLVGPGLGVSVAVGWDVAVSLGAVVAVDAIVGVLPSEEVALSIGIVAAKVAVGLIVTPEFAEDCINAKSAAPPPKNKTNAIRANTRAGRNPRFFWLRAGGGAAGAVLWVAGTAGAIT